MSDLICGLLVLAVAMPVAAWLLPKLDLYRDSLVCGLCKRVLAGRRSAHPRPVAARCRNCRIHEQHQQVATLVATDDWDLPDAGLPTRQRTRLADCRNRLTARSQRRANQQEMRAYLRDFLHDLDRLRMLSEVAADEQKRRDQHDH